MPVQDKATLVLAGEKEGIGKKKLTDTNLGSEVIEKLSPSSDSSSNLIFPAVDPADEEILSLIGINSHTTTEEKQQKNLDTLEPYDLDESQFEYIRNVAATKTFHDSVDLSGVIIVSLPLEQAGKLVDLVTARNCARHNIPWVPVFNRVEDAEAFYLSSHKVIVLIEEACTSPMASMIGSTLLHELIHAAQDMRYPGFEENLYNLGLAYKKNYAAADKSGDIPPTLKSLEMSINARQCWSENHVEYFESLGEEGLLKQNNFVNDHLYQGYPVAILFNKGTLKPNLRGYCFPSQLGKELVEKVYTKPHLTDLIFRKDSHVLLPHKTANIESIKNEALKFAREFTTHDHIILEYY